MPPAAAIITWTGFERRPRQRCAPAAGCLPAPCTSLLPWPLRVIDVLCVCACVCARSMHGFCSYGCERVHMYDAYPDANPVICAGCHTEPRYVE